LLAVRRFPLLRGTSMGPISARRAARRAAKSAKSMRRPGQSVGAVEGSFDAVLTHRLLANAAFQIVHVDAGVKPEQLPRLPLNPGMQGGCPLPAGGYPGCIIVLRIAE
jgi:hypothetical protein